MKVSQALEPIFLEAGKALYICQLYESSLTLLLSLMTHEAHDREEDAFEEAWDFHSGKTLGYLVNRLRQWIDIPDDFYEFLDQGVKARNRIVHGFLTKRAIALNHPDARAQIERELADLKMEVKRRDVVTVKLLVALLKKHGTSNEQLRREADLLWDRLNPDNGRDAE